MIISHIYDLKPYFLTFVRYDGTRCRKEQISNPLDCPRITIIFAVNKR